MATQEKYPNRWVQLVLGIVCMATVANCQYGWTLFVAPIEDKYHWARTAIQLSFTIFIFFETWLVPIEGWAVDKFGPRPVIMFGAIMATIGWVMYSWASSLAFLYAAAVITGMGAGAVYGTCSGNSLKWFPDKRGLAAGATAAGFGAGAAFTVVPVANMMQLCRLTNKLSSYSVFCRVSSFSVAQSSCHVQNCHQERKLFHALFPVKKTSPRPRSSDNRFSG